MPNKHQLNPIVRTSLIHTPEDPDELYQWVSKHPQEVQAPALIASGMMQNLCSVAVDQMLEEMAKELEGIFLSENTEQGLRDFLVKNLGR